LEIDLSLPAERVVRDQQNRPAADGHDRPLLADSVEKVGFSADLNSGTTIA